MRKAMFGLIAVAGLMLAGANAASAAPMNAPAIVNGANGLSDVVQARKVCSAWRYRGYWRGVRHYRRYCRYY